MGASPKQASFIEASTARINLAHGAVRSGKTLAAIAAFIAFCGTGPHGDMAVFGRTERTIRSNIVNEMKNLVGAKNIRYVQGSGELYVFGRRCWVIGVSNIEAEQKVRGMTLSGGLMNEITTYPQEVFDQAIARSLTVPGARFFADTNPDSPYHWVAENYLNAGLDIEYFKSWRFFPTDNPVFTAEAYRMAEALYPPGTLFHRRNLLSEWVMAEGAVYDMFDERIHVTDKWPSGFAKVIVGVDYATSTTTCFLMAGLSADDGRWYCFREYYWDAQAKGRQKTDSEYAEDLKTFLRGEGYPDPYGELHPTSVEIDPSAASFKLQCKRHGISRARDADNEVLAGIRVVGSALAGGKYLIHRVCTNNIKEKSSYVWDEKAQEKGEDKPLKLYDHAMDAERYMLIKAIGKQYIQVLKAA